MIPGTVQVTAPIAPTNVGDTYATHWALYGKGGYRTVATIAERDAITAFRREAYMKVIVVTSGLAYTLDPDLTTWVVDPADPDLSLYQLLSGKGVASGYCDLDVSGNVPLSRLGNVTGGLAYKGSLNGSTGAPTAGGGALANGSGTNGWYYKCAIAGSHNYGGGSITLAISDWLIYNGATWEKIANADLVSDVFGRTGPIVATAGDYTSDLIEHTPSGIGIVTLSTVEGAIQEIEQYVSTLASGGGLAIADVFKVQSVAVNTTIIGTDRLIAVTTAGINLTLPDPSLVTAGIYFVIKDESGNAGTNPITFSTPIGSTLEGVDVGDLINSDYGYVWLYSKGGSIWYILMSK